MPPQSYAVDVSRAPMSKRFYYRGLANYEDEPGWLLDTCRAFQDDFAARFLPLVPHLA